MRIGIDARFFGPKNKGLGRYTEKLLAGLEEVDEDSGLEYYVFLSKEGAFLYNPKNKNKFKKIIVDCPWYSWKEQLVFPFILNKYKLDLVHFCHFNVPIFYRKKFVVTIHDLILINYPTEKNTTLNKLYYKFKLLAYKNVIKSATKRARTVIAVSDFTKKDILRNFRIRDDKVLVVKEGFSLDKGNLNKNIKHNYQKNKIKTRYILYVGNAYPHKNLERLCLVFKRIKKDFPDLKLVLVGKEDYFYQRIQEFIKKNKICGIMILKDINDRELCLLYKGAEFFVFPSLYEGFGLPPLEALSFSTPVISSDRASMKEVLGEVALYFNPEDLDEMEMAIRRGLDSKDFLNSKMKFAPAQLKKFSWKKMAEEILKLYKKQ